MRARWRRRPGRHACGATLSRRRAFGDGEAEVAVVRIVAGQMIRLEGELLAANGHCEIEPDEGQPAHRPVRAPQLGNVAGHNDRFERLVVRLELVIDPAAAMRSENVRVADQPRHATAVSSDRRRFAVDMGKIQHVEDKLRGQLLAFREAIQDHRARSADLSHTTRRGDASINQGRNVQTARPTSVGPTLPSVPRWFKGARVLTPSVAPTLQAATGRLVRARGCRCGHVPRVCPRNITTMIRMHTMHRGWAATRAASRQAQPSQREGQGFESP